MERLIAKALAPIFRRLRLLAGRAVISLVNDSLKEQVVQLKLLDGEVGDAERYQHYGFTSHPHPGGEAIFLGINGSREHLVVIADGDRRYRLKSMAQGEVAIYDDQGQVIHLKRDKHIHVYGADRLTADIANDVEVNTTRATVDASESVDVTSPDVTVHASNEIVFDTPLATFTGDLAVAGTGVVTGALSSETSVSDPGGSMQDNRDTYNSHDHNENGDGGGVTDAPNQQQ